ncbi:MULTISPECIES: hypothetical protein [Proteus]|uniref:hypothetical protein n=1 Tax=Proteus TaxID=583 RepID=UPI000D69AC76|nr:MULTISPECIES: hypothetical protein [Proteus]MDC9754379.1 hypothetical protein [Proteus mirabilis]
MSTNTITSNQEAFLTRAIKSGEGRIEIGELATALGKQKNNMIRKLEKSFDAESLFKMKSHFSVFSGINRSVEREVSTYMLDPKVAGALAMSYDLQLGVKVLTILEEAINTIEQVSKATTLSQAKETTTDFLTKHKACLEYKPNATEKEDRSVALRRLNRRTLGGLD